MFEKGMYLYILYCLCFLNEIPENMVEKQVIEETDSDLEGGEYLRIFGDS